MDIQVLHDLLKAELPIQIDDKKIICVHHPLQLMSIKKEISHLEHMSMTCRPVPDRTDAESLIFFEQYLQDQNNVLLGIQRDADMMENPYRIIGRISFFDFNPRNASIELGFYLKEEYRQQGIMRQALRRIIVILFSKTEIRKVYAQTGAFNQPSITLLTKLGFHLDGTLREHHELQGKYDDDYIFSLLASELRLKKDDLYGDI